MYIFIVRRHGPGRRKGSTMNSTVTSSTWRGIGSVRLYLAFDSPCEKWRKTGCEVKSSVMLRDPRGLGICEGEVRHFIQILCVIYSVLGFENVIWNRSFSCQPLPPGSNHYLFSRTFCDSFVWCYCQWCYQECSGNNTDFFLKYLCVCLVTRGTLCSVLSFRKQSPQTVFE